MTPQEAERLRGSLVALNEAAHQLRQAQDDGDPDEIEEANDQAYLAIGRFTGMTRIYQALPVHRIDELLCIAQELQIAHQTGDHPHIAYGAVEGAITALTERTP